jgi:aspartate-semialdehyde dehydrogenase
MRVGIIGWRGMVGSVLLERMQAEGDFELIQPTFFSTTQAGFPAPISAQGQALVCDANDMAALLAMDALLTCQGGNYTERMHPVLRAAGWGGYWIDAASTLRMRSDAVIVLDPVNRDVIDAALSRGQRDFIGGNCTVSLLLLALAGLLKEDLIEWISSMTYQAASGAGAANMRELVAQMAYLGVESASSADVVDGDASILGFDRAVARRLRDNKIPVAEFGQALAGNLIPWIDSDLGTGQSREEWKSGAEANKILDRAERPIAIDGVCVRVGVMRCHSQALTIKLRRPMDATAVEDALRDANQWVRVITNTREQSMRALTPLAVSGTMDIPIGRIRNLPMGPEYISAFTVGDQLLWGAAEPLRRMLRLIVTGTP